MDMKRIEEIAYRQMGERKELKSREPGWLYYHGLRTAKIACQLCRAMNVDDDADILYVGALFHDIGKGIEPHNITGAEEVRRLLANKCESDKLDTICQIVELHNQRHDSAKHPLLARIVQDADLVDHVGPISPWLAFYWSGTYSESMQDHVTFASGEECRAYINGMRKHLNFDSARKMFDRRIQWEHEVMSTIREVYFNGLWGEETAERIS